MDEEDHFHKNLLQKKTKFDQRIHRSTPTVVQAGFSNSKRPIADQFQRGVI